MDGARIFNAMVRYGVRAARRVAQFDTVSICLSKGLGAPVGSVLCGPADRIRHARRLRKALGGGMRQSGVLAAAGLHALDHHVERMDDDHRRARRLAQELAALPGIDVDLASVQTNMAYVDFGGTGRDGAAWERLLAAAGVLANATGPTTLRFVTHLQVGDDGVDAAVAAVKAALPG